MRTRLANQQIANWAQVYGIPENPENTVPETIVFARSLLKRLAEFNAK